MSWFECECFMQQIKGISPLIAVVLLIAFTVATAGIINVWLAGFTRQSSDTVSNESISSLKCSYGGVALKSLKYANANISGAIENTGTIGLNRIQIQALFKNATSAKVALCGSSTAPYNCSTANLSIAPRESAPFNISIGGSNYDKIRVLTDCASIYDSVDSSEVSS